MTGPDAYRTLASNRYGTWSRRGWFQDDEAVHPDDVPRRMREDIFLPGLTGKFRLHRDAGLFAMGSCFARVVEDAFAAQGKAVLSRPADLFERPLFAMANPHVRPVELVNRYNLASMHAEIRRLLTSDLQDDQWLIHAGADGRHHDLHYYDHWVVYADLASILQRRQIIRDRFAALRRADIVILTLGLIETWFDRESDEYLNVTPPAALVTANPDRFEFRLLDYDENLSYLLRIRDLLHQCGQSGLRLIVTVSPVPLAATFTSDDVVVANSRSKCTLRAVADEVARRFPDVDYFPSFEVAQGTRPDRAYLADGRHPTRELSTQIARLFERTYFE